MGQKFVFPQRTLTLKKPYFILDVINQKRFFYNFEKNLKYCLKNHKDITMKTKSKNYRFEIFTKNHLYHINFFTTSASNTVIEVRPIIKKNNSIISIDYLVNETFNMYNELEHLYIFDAIIY